MTSAELNSYVSACGRYILHHTAHNGELFFLSCPETGGNTFMFRVKEEESAEDTIRRLEDTAYREGVEFFVWAKFWDQDGGHVITQVNADTFAAVYWSKYSWDKLSPLQRSDVEAKISAAGGNKSYSALYEEACEMKRRTDVYAIIKQFRTAETEAFRNDANADVFESFTCSFNWRLYDWQTSLEENIAALDEEARKLLNAIGKGEYELEEIIIE